VRDKREHSKIAERGRRGREREREGEREKRKGERERAGRG